MGKKKKRAKFGQKKHAQRRRRGKARQCSHVDRSTGKQCKNRVTGVRSNLRVFCKEHRGRHDPRHKTRVIADKNNRDKAI